MSTPFPKPGEWPCHRRDGTMQARSPLKGNITEPTIAWKHFVGLVETQLIVSPDTEDRAVPIPTGELTQEPDTGLEPVWGISPPLGMIAGQMQPVRSIMTETYADILPEVPGLEKVDFGPIDSSNRAGRLLAWQDDHWRTVWQNEPYPIWQWHPTPIAGDFDNDGELEIAYLPWYDLVLLDARTGRVKDRVRFRTPFSGRSYGFIGAYDLTGDGRSEFVILADFPKHIDVLGYRDGQLSLFWQREFEQNANYHQKLLQYPLNPVADVDGDGRPELMINTLNDARDWRWRLTVHDALTGEVKVDLVDEYVHGVVDVDGDGITELLTTRVPGGCPPAYGTIMVRRLTPSKATQLYMPREESAKAVTLWQMDNAAWQLWEHSLPLNTNASSTDGASCDRRDALFRVVDGRATVVIRQPAPGEPEGVCLSVASWEDGGFRIGTTVTGPRLEGLALDDSKRLLVQAQTAPGSQSLASVHTGQAQVLASYRKVVPRGQPAVAWEDGADRPTIIVRSSRDQQMAFHPPVDGQPATERWRMRGMGQSGPHHDLWPGPVVADLRGDGHRQHVYATAGPGNCGRLVAADLAGHELWHQDFPHIMGTRVRETTDGMSDIMLWCVGHFTDPLRQDVLVTVRRSIHTSEESYLLSGLDGHIIWQRDKQVMPTSVLELSRVIWGVGGNAFTIADYDGDGLDEINGTYPGIFQVLDGATGENVYLVNGWGRQWDSGPAKPVVMGATVAVDPQRNGAICLLHSKALLRPDGELLWANETDPVAGDHPAIGDLDGDGQLEMLVRVEGYGAQCHDVATGRVKWRLPLAGAGGPAAAHFGGWESACADIDGDRRDEALLVLGNMLSCVGTAPGGGEGLVKWQLELPAQVGPPTIADLEGNGLASILMAGDDGYLYCIR